MRVERSSLIINFTALLLCSDQGYERMDDLDEAKLSSEELDRELEVLQNLAARTPKFVEVDSLPLFPEALTSRGPASSSFPDRSFRLRDQNQYFTGPRAGPGEVLQPLFHRFSNESGPSLRAFNSPIQGETTTGGGDFSVRRASGVHNVTARETKRPKEREKDKEYRRRTLAGADIPLCAFPTNILTSREGLQPPPPAERRIAQQGGRAVYVDSRHLLSLSPLPTEIGTGGRLHSHLEDGSRQGLHRQGRALTRVALSIGGRLHFHLEDGARQGLHRPWRALTRVARSKLLWSMREGRSDMWFSQRWRLSN